MELEKTLQSIGFNKSQIVIFLSLLKNGTSFPPNIASTTGITRTNCYAVLKSLAEIGLVQEVMVKKRKAYQANDPDSIIDYIEQKKSLAKESLPELYNYYSPGQYKPRIRYLDRIEEIETVIQEMTEDDQYKVLGDLTILSTLGLNLPQTIKDRMKVSKNKSTKSNDGAVAISIMAKNKILYIIIGEQTTATIIENQPITDLLLSI